MESPAYEIEKARIVAEIQAMKTKIKKTYPQWWTSGKFMIK